MATVPVLAQSGWAPVPLVTEEVRAAGHLGGEGCQWPQALVASADDKLLLFGTDVGGIYRSTNGGDLWEPCNVGYFSRGNSGFAIDPHNSMRAIAVGANSAAHEYNGLYLSTDGAASWRGVLPVRIRGYRDFRRQVAYDPSTFDAATQSTRVVYWSRVLTDQGNNNPEIHPALYRSDDGGETWTELADSKSLGGCEIAVHPTSGALYAAGPDGFFISTDRGASSTRILAEPCNSLTVVAGAPDRVIITSDDAILLSRDAGRSFEKLSATGLPAGKKLRFVSASPADPNRLLIWADVGAYNFPRFLSTDEGRTWTQVKLDNSLAFMPVNGRQGIFAWSGTDVNRAWSVGSDWITRSTDGGRTFAWAANGYNAILVGGTFNFCQLDPDVLFVGSQDYNGAVTTNGGQTWTYTNASGLSWGGFTYGGYAASKDILVVGIAGGWGPPYKLAISRDGGKTWDRTDIEFARPAAAFGDPLRPNVIFVSHLRSDDSGVTWKPMQDCKAVYTADSIGDRALYGVGGERDLVRSTDGGASWQVIATAPGGIKDIAVDSARGRIYVVAGSRLVFWDGTQWQTISNIPKDRAGDLNLCSVALDPIDPSIVYLANHRNLFMSDVSVVRSKDAGATWQNLTLTQPLDGKLRDGGREAIWVRVHPKTREAWVAGSCMGIWKIPAE